MLEQPPIDKLVMLADPGHRLDDLRSAAYQSSKKLRVGHGRKAFEEFCYRRVEFFHRPEERSFRGCHRSEERSFLHVKSEGGILIVGTLKFAQTSRISQRRTSNLHIRLMGLKKPEIGLCYYKL